MNQGQCEECQICPNLKHNHIPRLRGLALLGNRLFQILFYFPLLKMCTSNRFRIQLCRLWGALMLDIVLRLFILVFLIPQKNWHLCRGV